MNWVTVVWSMVAAVCLTLGSMHLIVWASQREAWARFWFALASISVAVLAAAEFVMMQAASVEAYTLVQRWAHVPVFVILVSMIWFVYLYFGAGLKWLLWLIVACRCLVLVINFSGPASVNYTEITALVPFELMGEAVQVAVGVPNPWSRFAEASLLLIVLFVLHAATAAWRRNAPRDRQRAVVIGASLSACLIGSVVNVFLLHTGQVSIPYFLSWSFVFFVVAMSYELSVDLSRAAELARDLQETRTRLELAAEAANLGFWEWDVARDRFWATDQLQRLFEFDRDDPITLDAVLDNVHPDDRAAVDAAGAEIRAGGGSFRVDYRVQLRSGETRWVAWLGRSQVEGGGRMLGVVLDVTEQHESEHERIQLREQLAHSGRVTMLGQLASSLAHELNQPLGAILRNAEAAELLMAANPPDLEELRAIVVDIRRDDQRAGEVIAKLRSLLTPHRLESKTIEVVSLIDEVLSLVGSEASAREVRLLRRFGPSPAIVCGDPVHLQQVLLNLVINGLDAAQSGPESERFVSVSTKTYDDRMLEVTVSDSGPGVPPGKGSLIFEPFYTTKPTGMGIGLSICRTIIEAHGGRVWVDTQVGGGATFRFTLPIQPGVPAS